MLRFGEDVTDEGRSMDRTLIAATLVFLAGCAASEVSAPPAAETAAIATAATAASTPTLANVQQVEMRTLTDDTECRRESPTGSRIAVMHCYSTAATANDEVNDDVLKRDIEEMRMRQFYQQQARDAALASMIRRAATGP